jgi:hypothetical protein
MGFVPSGTDPTAIQAIADGRLMRYIVTSGRKVRPKMLHFLSKNSRANSEKEN